MAKLNVVVPAVDVTIDGTVYTKVERKAAVGDVLRMPGRYSFITDGGFYEVTRIDGAGDPQITDDDGDEYDTCSDDFEVYAKVADKPQDDVITHEGRRYRKVARNANVGELVVITHGDYKAGRIGKCTKSGGYADGSIYVDFTDDDESPRFIDCAYEGYVVLVEPIETASARLKVGDYAKVRNYPSKYMANGTIVKVTENDRAGKYAYRAVTVNGGLGDIFLADQLVKVSAEEIAKAETEAKWAAIGRKVDEFKAGDIVECTGSISGHKIGTIGEMAYCVTFNKLRVKADGVLKSHAGQMRLVTPVEQRFDR